MNLLARPRESMNSKGRNSPLLSMDSVLGDLPGQVFSASTHPDTQGLGGPTHPWPPPKPLVRSCLTNGFVCPVNSSISSPRKSQSKSIVRVPA
jgi:hypothetical protein